MASGKSFLDWYCRPEANGAWTTLAQGALGAYTPCATETLVVSVSNLFLWCSLCYRIYLFQKVFNGFSVKRFRLQCRYYNYGLALLAAYNTAEPLYRPVMVLSIVNLAGKASLPPFEVVTLLIESITWCTMLALLFIETKIYIREFRWYIRFGVIYVLVGDATLLNLVLPVKDYCDKYVLNLYISEILCQAFGVLNLENIYTFFSRKTSQDATVAAGNPAGLQPDLNLSWTRIGDLTVNSALKQSIQTD